ncbi:MAG: hypothetical protein LBI26_00310 [Holosporales bacterium]|nr:hypothetical protein [Holosporales bacterium]
MNYGSSTSSRPLLSEKYRFYLGTIEKQRYETGGEVYTPEYVVVFDGIETGTLFAGVKDCIFVFHLIEPKRLHTFGAMGYSKTGSATMLFGPIGLIIKAGQHDSAILGKYHGAVIKTITVTRFAYISNQEFPSVSETMIYDFCQITESESGHPDWTIYEFNYRKETIEIQSSDQTLDGEKQKENGKKVYSFDIGNGSYKSTKE